MMKALVVIWFELVGDDLARPDEVVDLEIFSRPSGLSEDCLAVGQVVRILRVGATAEETEHFVRCGVCRKLVMDAAKAGALRRTTTERESESSMLARYGPVFVTLMDGADGRPEGLDVLRPTCPTGAPGEVATRGLWTEAADSLTCRDVAKVFSTSLRQVGWTRAVGDWKWPVPLMTCPPRLEIGVDN